MVLSLLFELCTEGSDPIISGVTPHLDAIQEPGTKTAIEGGLDFSSVISTLQTSNIFQYTGSLTTPPCSESVLFLIMETPLKISVPDFNAIKKTVRFNSRITQNTLGGENIIAVGAASGASASQGNASSEATVTQAGPSSGATVMVTEISGQAVATPIVGIVPRVRRFRH